MKLHLLGFKYASLLVLLLLGSTAKSSATMQKVDFGPFWATYDMSLQGPSPEFMTVTVTQDELAVAIDPNAVNPFDKYSSTSSPQKSTEQFPNFADSSLWLPSGRQNQSIGFQNQSTRFTDDNFETVLHADLTTEGSAPPSAQPVIDQASSVPEPALAGALGISLALLALISHRHKSLSLPR